MYFLFSSSLVAMITLGYCIIFGCVLRVYDPTWEYVRGCDVYDYLRILNYEFGCVVILWWLCIWWLQMRRECFIIEVCFCWHVGLSIFKGESVKIFGKIFLGTNPARFTSNFRVKFRVGHDMGGSSFMVKHLPFSMISPNQWDWLIIFYFLFLKCYW